MGVTRSKGHSRLRSCPPLQHHRKSLETCAAITDWRCACHQLLQAIAEGMMRGVHTQLYVFRIGHKAVETWNVSFANHQNMLRSCRTDIPEGHHIVVLCVPRSTTDTLQTYTPYSGHACSTGIPQGSPQNQHSPFNVVITNGVQIRPTSNKISLLSSRLAILQNMHLFCVPKQSTFSLGQGTQADDLQKKMNTEVSNLLFSGRRNHAAAKYSHTSCSARITQQESPMLFGCSYLQVAVQNRHAHHCDMYTSQCAF